MILADFSGPGVLPTLPPPAPARYPSHGPSACNSLRYLLGLSFLFLLNKVNVIAVTTILVLHELAVDGAVASDRNPRGYEARG